MISPDHALASEEERIRSIFAARQNSALAFHYAWHQPDVLFSIYRLNAAASRALARAGRTNLESAEVLDVGCGTGGWLRQLVEWGAHPTRLHGLDLVPDRISTARRRNPLIDVQEASGWAMPFADGAMDLVTANTVFSSVLSDEGRAALAGEMVRVLRPGGLVMIYDFRIRAPWNPDTVGIRRGEIRRLFPGMRLHEQRLTLAPPIARRLFPIAPWLTILLEGLVPPLRTHSLYVLEKPAV